MSFLTSSQCFGDFIWWRNLEYFETFKFSGGVLVVFQGSFVFLEIVYHTVLGLQMHLETVSFVESLFTQMTVV